MNNKENQIKKYLSLREAANLSPYSQDYLSLRARQGKLKALKMGRNWVTTDQWVKEYIDSNQYISFKEAAENSSYSQDYLTLRARQKKLRAIKLDGKWTTTQKWLDDYIDQVGQDKTKKTEKKTLPRLNVDFSFLKLPKLPVLPEINLEAPKGLIDLKRKLILVIQGVEKTIGRNIDRGLIVIEKFIFHLIYGFWQFKNHYFFKKIVFWRDSFEADLIRKLKLLKFGLKWRFYQNKTKQELDDLSQYFEEKISKIYNNFGRIFNFKGILGLFLIVFLIISIFSYFSPGIEAGLAASKTKLAKISIRAIKQGSIFVVGEVNSFDYFIRIADKKNEELKISIKSGIPQLVKGAPVWLSGQAKLLIAQLEILSLEITRSFNEKHNKFAALVPRAPRVIEISVSNFIKSLSDTAENLSDIISDIPKKLSDTSKNMTDKLFLTAPANFKENVNFLNKRLSQLIQKTKDKLGDAYLKLVKLFDPYYRDADSLVYAPKNEFEQSVNSLEEGIINDIQGRFGNFRGDWQIDEKISQSQKEGVIVMPLEDDKETAQQKIDKLSQAFSDEVSIERDETGKAGFIQPIFEGPQVQKYLYMMVPVSEETNNE